MHIKRILFGFLILINTRFPFKISLIIISAPHFQSNIFQRKPHYFQKKEGTFSKDNIWKYSIENFQADFKAF